MTGQGENASKKPIQIGQLNLPEAILRHIFESIYHQHIDDGVKVVS
jgi:hypothetical protein